jgi:hypothetical protein
MTPVPPLATGCWLALNVWNGGADGIEPPTFAS